MRYSLFTLGTVSHRLFEVVPLREKEDTEKTSNSFKKVVGLLPNYSGVSFML